MWVYPLCSAWGLSDAEILWEGWISSWTMQSTSTVTEANTYDREKHLDVWLRNNSHPVRCQHGTGHPFSSLHSAPKEQFPLFHFPSPLSNWAGPWENPDSLDLAGSVDVCRIAFLLSFRNICGKSKASRWYIWQELGSWHKVFSLSWVAAAIILGVPLVNCWLSPIPACFKALGWLLQSSWADVSPNSHCSLQAKLFWIF